MKKLNPLQIGLALSITVAIFYSLYSINFVLMPSLQTFVGPNAHVLESSLLTLFFLSPAALIIGSISSIWRSLYEK